MNKYRGLRSKFAIFDDAACIDEQEFKDIIKDINNNKYTKTIRVIETNLSMKDGIIIDHQSRIVVVESWDTYVNYYLEHYNEDIIGCALQKEFKCISNLIGNTLPRLARIENLEFDDYHLSCEYLNPVGMSTKKLAYNADFIIDK